MDLSDKRPSSRFTVINESSRHQSRLEKLTEGPKLISSGRDDPTESFTLALPSSGDSVALDTLQKAYDYKLKLQETMWRQKMQKLEQLNDKLLKQNSLKLAEEVGQFEERHFGHGIASAYTESPCHLVETAVIDCYYRNGKRSLLCSDLVKDFSECVRLASFDFLKSH